MSNVIISIVELTMLTAAVGGNFVPDMILCHMTSKGRSSSQGIVKSGESQRTIDEGSSNRMIKFSKLLIVKSYSSFDAHELTSQVCKLRFPVLGAILDIYPEVQLYGSHAISVPPTASLVLLTVQTRA